MRDWSSGQILRTGLLMLTEVAWEAQTLYALTCAARGVTPSSAAIMPVEAIGCARINCESAQSFDPQSAQGQEDLR
jgi:hypothetical protein